MYLVTQKPGNFGANDVLACGRCNGEMTLTRRSPHEELGPRYERQWFTCRGCQREVSRSVDAEGKPVADRLHDRAAPNEPGQIDGSGD